MLKMEFKQAVHTCTANIFETSLRNITAKLTFSLCNWETMNEQGLVIYCNLGVSNVGTLFTIWTFVYFNKF